MPDREPWLEDLVARCLEAGLGYRVQLEQLCFDHPEAADELRRRIAQLEELGFLGAREPPSPWADPGLAADDA